MIDSQHINMLNHHIGEAKKYLGVLDRESSCQEALDALYDANKHLASADSHLSSVEFENRENELKQLKILGKKIRSHKEQFFGSACFDQELFNHGHFYGLKKQLKLPRS